MISATYKQYFERTMGAICSRSQGGRELVELFAQVAEPWMTCNIADGPGFSSGLTASGSPLELSISLGHDGTTAVRFLAQPGVPGQSVHKTREFVRQCCVAQIRGITSPKCSATAEAVVGVSLGHVQPSFGGNFLVWIGGESTAQSLGCLKLYLNPWAAEESIGHVISRTLEAAMYGDSAFRCVLEAQRLLGENAFINLIGLNVGSTELVALKLYFVIRNTKFESLNQFLSVFGSDHVRKACSTAFAHPEDSGEVHVAITAPCSNDAKLDIKVSLLCKDFFYDDDSVFNFVDEVFTPRGQAAIWRKRLQEFLKVSTDATLRHITFLGIGSRKWDIYFTP